MGAEHSDSFASSPSVRRKMQLQSSDNTTPELLLRKEMHRRGLRYRVGIRPERSLRRKADIVFTKARVSVFVDGCFWHKCPEHGSIPSTNQDYWEPKLHRNAERDAETDAYLQDKGWAVVRIWEHEDPQEAASRIQRVVEERSP